MYRIKCDGYDLFDPRDDEFLVEKPSLSLGVNKVGEGSFTIHRTHPNYDKLKKLKSVFEVSDELGIIFKGRMTGNSYDWNNSTFVDLEGSMAYFNDSRVRPYKFPDDFLTDPKYIEAAQSGNVVSFFLGWLIEQHNEQVQPFQRFKLGRVTVSDPNNYITREDSTYPSTWGVLKTKLFDSSLGGYLCIRYDTDGSFIDYLSEFELTNTQEIAYGENLLGLNRDSDATETYSAVIPFGAELEVERESEDPEAEVETEKAKVNISGIADGDITSDIVKSGDMIYSKSAVESYGVIFAPVDKTTWDDITDQNNLLQRAMEFLITDGMLLSDTAEFTAADLHFTDEQIQSFRLYRNVKVRSAPHGMNGVYPLVDLSPDLQNPQNTKITVGVTRRTLTDINSDRESQTIDRIEQAEQNIKENASETSQVRNQLLIKMTSILNDSERIILDALESYVETSDYEEYKETVRSEFEQTAKAISLNFTTMIDEINNVDGDLQAKFTQLYKYIKFSGETAISIGSGDSAITLEIDNEKGIVFKKNGVQFGLWDGEDFYTGNIVVRLNERAQFGNFAFVPRSDGSLSFLKVGG